MNVVILFNCEHIHSGQNRPSAGLVNSWSPSEFGECTYRISLSPCSDTLSESASSGFGSIKLFNSHCTLYVCLLMILAVLISIVHFLGSVFLGIIRNVAPKKNFSGFLQFGFSISDAIY